MARRSLPKQAKFRLVLLLAVGGAVGAFAATVSSRGTQLALVAVAVGLGVCAGIMVRHAVVRKEDPLGPNRIL